MILKDSYKIIQILTSVCCVEIFAQCCKIWRGFMSYMQILKGSKPIKPSKFLNVAQTNIFSHK